MDHTDRATCELCGNSGNMDVKSNDILMCQDCDYKDTRVRNDEELHERALEVQSRFKSIDSTLRVQTDIFNAKTIAINELKLAIGLDSSIPADQKHFTLARMIDQRFQILKDLIFNRRQEISEAESEQRAIHAYYNELGKKLRTEERAAIRLKDAQYRPIEPLKISKPKTITVKKYDKDAIRAAAKEHGFPEALLQMLCVAQGISVIDAVRALKEAKSEHSK